MQVVCSILVLINVLGLDFKQERVVRGFTTSMSATQFVVDFSEELAASTDLFGSAYDYKHTLVRKERCVVEYR